MKFYREPDVNSGADERKKDILKKLKEEKVDVLGVEQYWFVNLRPLKKYHPSVDSSGEFHEEVTKENRSFRFAEMNLLYRNEEGGISIDWDVVRLLTDKEVLQ